MGHTGQRAGAFWARLGTFLPPGEGEISRTQSCEAAAGASEEEDEEVGGGGGELGGHGSVRVVSPACPEAGLGSSPEAGPLSLGWGEGETGSCEMAPRPRVLSFRR